MIIRFIHFTGQTFCIDTVTSLLRFVYMMLNKCCVFLLKTKGSRPWTWVLTWYCPVYVKYVVCISEWTVTSPVGRSELHAVKRQAEMLMCWFKWRLCSSFYLLKFIGWHLDAVCYWFNFVIDNVCDTKSVKGTQPELKRLKWLKQIISSNNIEKCHVSAGISDAIYHDMKYFTWSFLQLGWWAA